MKIREKFKIMERYYSYEHPPALIGNQGNLTYERIIHVEIRLINQKEGFGVYIFMFSDGILKGLSREN